MKVHNHIHFIGIGGISMSALAMIMLKKGCKVSGSDRSDSELTEKLKEMGVTVFIGHHKENIQNPDLVVYTAAIPQDNVELLAARELNIECLERADFLGELTTDFACPIAISGTHGKTTTTSLISCIFLQENDPTILVGGTLDKIGGNVQIGTDQYLIFEACEYKDSFLKFYPKIAIVLNLEADHLDYFSGIVQIKESFSSFLNKIPDDGFAVINNDDRNLMDAATKASCKKVTYGLNNADYTAKNIRFSPEGTPIFDICHQGNSLGMVHLKVTGVHNISNATGAFALAHTMGLSSDVIINGIESFHGTDRRFELKGTVNEKSVYDDYAHHPTEITATLTAAKNLPHHKIWCIFQPHTYTRTKALLDDFAVALSHADHVIVTDIYAAREPNDPTIHAKDIVNKLSNAIYISDFEDIASEIAIKTQPNDIIFTMGAGNINALGDIILNKL